MCFFVLHSGYGKARCYAWGHLALLRQATRYIVDSGETSLLCGILRGGGNDIKRCAGSRICG